MTGILFRAMAASEARHFQAGGADAYGLAPERRVSDGDGVPCRHCLQDVAKGEDTPAMLMRRQAHLIKGYGLDDRIVYGTGKVVPSADLETEAAKILQRGDVAYVHVRSALNNCFTCRIDRGGVSG